MNAGRLRSVGEKPPSKYRQFAKEIKQVAWGTFSMITTSLKLRLGLLLSTMRRKVLGPYASHLLVNAFNGKLLVPAEDFAIGRKLAFRGEYDRSHIERILQLVDRQSKVLFVGAHIGSLVIPIAKAVHEVVAIEANPTTFDTLLMNLSLNDCRNVRALNVAASDKREMVRFLNSHHNSGGSKIEPNNLRDEFVYDNPDVIHIQAAPLDDLLCDFCPSHVVMDIEGAEIKAIAGMPRLLASSAVFVVEFLPNHIENIAGISCADFLRRIPFDHIQLLDDPNEVNIIEAARSRHYYGGADLLCRKANPAAK